MPNQALATDREDGRLSHDDDMVEHRQACELPVRGESRNAMKILADVSSLFRIGLICLLLGFIAGLGVSCAVEPENEPASMASIERGERLLSAPGTGPGALNVSSRPSAP